MTKIFRNISYTSPVIIPPSGVNHDWTALDYVNKFGYNPDIDTGTTPEDVWDSGGVYAGFLTVANRLKLSSTESSDNQPGGGARTVQVQGLNASYAPLTESLTTDGASSVTTTSSFIRVFRMKVTSAGVTAINTGTLNCSTLGNTHMARVTAGVGQTLMALYTVRSGYTAYLSKLQVASGKVQDAYADVSLLARPFGEAWQTKEFFSIHSNGGPVDIVHPIAPVYTQKTDLKVRVTTVSNNSMSVAAWFDMLMVKNS